MTVIRRLDAVLESSKQQVLYMKEQLDTAGIVHQDAALRRESGQALYNISPYTLRDLRNRSRAQQLRSKVDEEVVGNAATSLYGRIGDEEITNSSYRSFTAICEEIEGVPEDRIFEALDAVQSAARAGSLPADPYKNFAWNIKRGHRRSATRRDNSEILAGLDRMRD